MRSSKIESESSHRHLYMKCEICDRDVDHSRYQVLSTMAGQSYNNMGGMVQIIIKKKKNGKENIAADSFGSVCRFNTTFNCLGGISWWLYSKELHMLPLLVNRHA